MKHEYFIISSLLLFGLGALALTSLFHTQLGERLVNLYQTHEILSSSFVSENVLGAPREPATRDTFYVFNNEQRSLPAIDMAGHAQSLVLGSSTGVKKIIVDLHKQRVYAYEDDRLVFNFLVSTGKWGATPTGTYRIWYKVRSQTMKGGNQALGTYYYLPNVQWIQYFNKGIGFHSTYWHNNFGAPMSHGCVNMTTTDAETLYYWAAPDVPTGLKIFRATSQNQGTEVTVVDSWTI